MKLWVYFTKSLLWKYFFFTEFLSMEIFQNNVSFQRGSSIFIDAEYFACSTFSGLNIKFLKMRDFLPEVAIPFAVKFQ